MGTWDGIGAGLIGMIGGHQAQRRQHRDTKELMGMQHKNQRNLNQMGHDLQMDMWNKTNYKAQVDHMLEAGLNPALMYGSAGQGGQTGSQGGGSAAMGQAQQMKMMDMQNLLIGAQIEKLEAETKNISKDTDKKGGEINKLAQDVSESIARERNLSADEALKNEQKIKTIQETTNLKTMDEWNKVKQDLDELKREKKVTGSSIVDLMTQIGLDPTNNEDDKDSVRMLLGLFYGSTVAKNMMQGIGGLKGNVTKEFGDKVFNKNKN